jgi:hypothetical protein
MRNLMVVALTVATGTAAAQVAPDEASWDSTRSRSTYLKGWVEPTEACRLNCHFCGPMKAAADGRRSAPLCQDENYFIIRYRL